ncbi:hypothetical protein A4D02_15725 [Niastella koreensis]|uniref:Anti-FecI sigma factor, FecR n=2 Tax=Niastella koreensis TaxID=354356 RepID=G8TPK6_NIAKG|nr:FecR family protein [Niastella koreensis]AEV97827.1 anti-FecI sigma factor, FecR [Niastella koreensis GR20-10]OQP40364.1 hypothetical protein A4D02_15725 [Niastella koreensis]
MEEGINNWATLLKKYLRNNITQEAIEEMERQMEASPIKRQQFQEFTDPDVFFNQLREMHKIDKKKAWQELQAKLPFLHQPTVVINNRSTFSWKVGVKIQSIYRWMADIYKRSIYRWVVRIAAAIIIVVIGNWVFVSVFKNQGFPIKKNSYAVMPNGDEVNLENVSNGTLYKTAGYQINYTNQKLVISMNGAMLNKKLVDKIAVVTAAGKKILVRFSDGTEVQLNTQSSISAPICFRNGRDVVLTGEGYFMVAKNHDVPFVVSLKSKLKVIAEGTTFNICSYENQKVTTTLFEGRVIMKSGSDSILLKEGEQAETINNKKIKAVKNPDLAQAAAWRKGDFYFKNMPIRDVMIEIGRWYGYDVEFSDQGFENELASGKYERNSNIDSLTKALEIFNHININKVGRKLIISPAKK